MVGGFLYVTLRRSRPCVNACEGYVCVWRGWQMFQCVFLEAVTQEHGLPMRPLMGHMAGHCRHSALCEYSTIMSHIM